MFGGYLWYRAVSFPLERRTARKIGYLTVASPALGGELIVRYARVEQHQHDKAGGANVEPGRHGRVMGTTEATL